MINIIVDAQSIHVNLDCIKLNRTPCHFLYAVDTFVFKYKDTIARVEDI